MTAVKKTLARALLFFCSIAMALFCGATAHAFKTTGFQNPYGIVVDNKSGFIYVSSVNGGPGTKDDNGYISRLKGDGEVDQLKFIDGAAKETTLNAPKGIAIVGTTLYVADIDKLRAFDLTSGKFLFDVNFGDLPVQHFYDISTGPDEALYVADGPANVIYRVDIPRLHEVTTFASGDVLGQPHGICWFPARQLFLVAGWSSGQVVAFDRSGKRQVTPGIFLRALEGIRTDEGGGVYIASSALSAIFRMAPNFSISTFGLAQNSPAGIAFQNAGPQLLVASFDTGVVQSLPIQASK